MRVLGRVRLSRATEESTSVERQREFIEDWAKKNDHEVVAWAEDLDVSGSVDPFYAPALGPWLTDEKKHEWDILCAWKLDRISRRAIPMNKVFGWVLENEKTLYCTAENLDLTTWMGRMIANVIAGVAEGELEAIKERTRGSQKKLRELGRWGGGRTFYGYFAQEREDAAGWELVPDEHSSGVLRRIIADVLDGKSTESIARELNEAGELSPSDYLRQMAGRPLLGTRWSNAHLRQQLRSRTLLGITTHKGQTVRDDQGLPIRRGPALITQAEFDRLQAALDSRSFKVTNRSAKASPLLGIALCGICERAMHLRQHRHEARGKTYRYYQCKGAGEHETNIIQADLVEEVVADTFLFQLGERKVQERVYIQAQDHEIEIKQAQQAVDELTALLGTTTSDTVRSSVLKQLGALDSRLQQLEALPSREAAWDYVPTGKTYAEAWAEADTEGKRQLLLKSGITFAVSMPKGTKVLKGDLRIPPELKLQAYAADDGVVYEALTPETQKSPRRDP